jgi:SAM-dependent methyltransferase
MTGETAFDHVFGESPWQHRKKNPDLDAHFNAWLEQGASLAGQEISRAYDFSTCQSITDVGGAQGALLIAVLQAYPQLKGVLFDQPHVISAAQTKLESAGLQSRCQYVAGDFLNHPPPETDVCILKSILHDWDDDKSLAILKNCRDALKPGSALLVVEKIMPDFVAGHPTVVIGDLHMLAVTGGKERTVNEYKKLFSAVGFKLKKTTPLSTGHSVLETIRT